MALQDKYKQLITAAQQAGVTNLNVKEQNNVLYVEGSATSGQVKDNLWNIYNQIDPDYRSGDLVLNIDTNVTSGTPLKVVTESSNLNIRKGPGTDQPIVGKAAHNETVTLVSKTSDQWWLVRTKDGEEGYAYAQYLQA